MKKYLIVALMLIASKGFCAWDGGLARDNYSQSQSVISYNHEKIHLGEQFNISSMTVALANNASTYFVIDCATNTFTRTEMHMTFGVSTGGNAHLMLFKDVVVTSSGTAISAVNMNQASTRTPGIRVTGNGSPISSTGTKLLEVMLPAGSSPSGKNAGASTKAEEEFILKQGTKYLLILTNVSGSAAACNLVIEWYEEE